MVFIKIFSFSSPIRMSHATRPEQFVKREFWKGARPALDRIWFLGILVEERTSGGGPPRSFLPVGYFTVT
jgi:hypothetical protein